MKEMFISTVIVWLILIITRYDILLLMTSKNPIPVYVIGLFLISIMYSVVGYVIFNISKLIIKKLTRY